MTTLDPMTAACAVCGRLSAQMIVASSSVFGSPDLDTRPAEMARSTIDYWVQACPHCGYCAPELSQAPKSAAKIVEGAAYRAELASELPELARRFRCCSFIQARTRKPVDAAWSLVNAAWAADDEGADEVARRCRLEAVQLFEKALAAGRTVMSVPGGSEMLLADLLRRAGDFERALDYADRGLARQPDDLLLRLLEYERQLIEAQDTACHSVDHAMELRGEALF